MNIFAKKVAVALKKSVDCKRIGIAVIGLEVPHAHIHLIPINNVEDINFAKPKMKYTEEEYKEIAEAIKSKLEDI
jgi:histidine triad (HIT) family protein